MNQESVLSILVKARDLASGTLQRVGKSVDGLDKKIGKLAAKGARNAWRNTQRIAVGVVSAAAVGIGATIKAAADFESQMNTINTVAQLAGDATSGALGKIGDSIRKVSRDTGTPLEDLTQGYYDLVSAGIKASDAQNVLTLANTLAIGGLGTTAEAVDLLTTAINSYGGDARKAAQFTNYFAEAIAAGKTTTAQLAASFATVGPLAAKAGIGLDQIAAAVGVMTAKGTPTAEAMTQIRSAIVALYKPTSKMRAIQKELGVNFADMARKRGLAYTYNQIEKAAEKAGIPMVQLTGRIEGAQFAAQVAGTEFSKYQAELDKVHHSSDGAGEAADQAAKRQQGFNYELGRLKALARDAGITIGSKLLPAITPLMSDLAEFVANHQDDIAAFGDGLAGNFREVAGEVRTINFHAIGDALRIGGEGARIILGAFKTMPAWVQTAILTGWGFNKLTGGALGDIVGEVIKTQIKGVLGIQAAVVNVSGGVVNGGGGIPKLPGGPAAAGGEAVAGAEAAAGAEVAAGAISATGIAAAATIAIPIVAGLLIGHAINPNPTGGNSAGRGGGTGMSNFAGQNGLGPLPAGGLPVSDAGAHEMLRGLQSRNKSEHTDNMRRPSQVIVHLGKLGIDLKAIAAQRTANLSAAPSAMAGWAAGRQTWTPPAPKPVDIKGLRADTQAITAQQAVDAAVTASKLDNNEAAVRAGAAASKAATAAGAASVGAQEASAAASIVAAIRANRPITKVYVTPAAVTSSTTTAERNGSTTGSAGSNRQHPTR